VRLSRNENDVGLHSSGMDLQVPISNYPTTAVARRDVTRQDLRHFKTLAGKQFSTGLP
jgi:hypothetical protein